MPELQDKVVLVTGASRGIGRGIAQVLAREGARVVVSSIEEDVASEVAATLPGGAARHAAVLCDVADAGQRAGAIDFAVARFGRLDGLVNNAGINFVKPFTQTTPDDWRRVMSIDLDSVYDLSRLAIARFLQQGHGGAIVSVTSVHTVATYPGSAPYAAAKAAINLLSKGLATEFARHDIRVNCVAPGLVRTEIWRDLVASFGGDEAACLAYWRRNIPLGRIIEPEEIGEAVSFLLSSRARAMGGAVVYVDGGLTSQLIAARDDEPTPGV